jgi:hypothetical protein
VLFMACRTGPVRASDILRTALPIAAAALASLGAALLARKAFGPTHAALTLLLSAGVCFGTMLILLLPFASGRRALSDLLMMANFRRRFPA